MGRPEGGGQQEPFRSTPGFTAATWNTGLLASALRAVLSFRALRSIISNPVAVIVYAVAYFCGGWVGDAGLRSAVYTVLYCYPASADAAAG